MTPSTAIPYITSIGLVISTVLTPIIGTIIDRTTHRKAITFAATAVYIAVNAAQALISEGTWMFMLLLQHIVARNAFSIHVSCVAAYCTEIGEMRRGARKV
jgi:MFS-type transporter involved in bile tolerance (Atg22 family)